MSPLFNREKREEGVPQFIKDTKNAALECDNFGLALATRKEKDVRDLKSQKLDGNSEKSRNLREHFINFWLGVEREVGHSLHCSGANCK